MGKRELKPLCKNIRNFIFGNNWSNPQFADAMNRYIVENELDGKCSYDKNDIWTYTGRGTMPSEPTALRAIAAILDKPLEELLTKEFSQEELDKRSPQIQPIDRSWSVERFKELSPDEQQFVCELMLNLEIEEDRQNASFMVGVKYNAGRSVIAEIYFNGNVEKTLTWTWSEYGERVAILDDEQYAVESRLWEDIFDKLSEIGLVDDFYCISDEITELEKYENEIDGYYQGIVYFKKSVPELLEIFGCVAKCLNIDLRSLAFDADTKQE